ncbi:Glyoxylase, beta-lactamase superfamily II [Ferrithrix thermotolerans DSM 19514]|uniref:Glyoxylase, beta-lactamase superfamily II n=1 Tax=Ferrithrix thermotolerans DSM 19514 TaxID=1121881 RepID=A0A1M4SDF2_9ACTN|nr:MBL fold metallo-hydrolase [Ferrithrix thermotolerans]SHE30192.1 Glyoxylase, beta-lactamase superfamily II [Ferrithrix thermotolerans DSM 19514]
MIVVGLPLWVAQTNCWIISQDGSECVLIDVPPDPNTIVDELRQRNMKAVAVIATHGHVDHIGGISSTVAEEGHHTPVHIHPNDRHMLMDPLVNSSMLSEHLLASGVALTPPENIVGVTDGDHIKGAGMDFEVLHTPGHTQGSICLKVTNEDNETLLFSGDHLFRNSIGRTDLPGGSLEQLMVSMKEKILPLPDDITVLPGHGPTTTIGRERTHNPFILQIDR